MGAIEALGNQREDYCQLGTKRENKLPPLVVMRAAVAITGLLGATPPPHSPRVPPTQPSTPQAQPSSAKTRQHYRLTICMELVELTNSIR